MKIGELAAASGVTTKTIRFYESQGLMPEPDRTPSGYRDYTTAHVTRLHFIRRAQSAGLSLREAAQILAIHDTGEQPCGHVRTVLNDRLEHVQAQIAELTTLESHLRALLETAEGEPPSPRDTAGVCWILETQV
ncbi:heavy metal-responsive transcriptional regulator [Nocardia arizonensis]|uniref:heavy metal-responsive transcriptional regulator n=1 Tax=Nocardia arizonensis TaxID=1141647 RepID=UPI0006CF97F9|nr:heavy metal-responsive transcriptional regulator [Nocardia arizonensis]